MRRSLASWLVAIAVLVQTPAARSVQQAAAGRLTIVLSDLHMGFGRDAAGTWQPAEDFRWAVEFSAFLKAIDAQGHGATDLVLNGDTFELVEAVLPGCKYGDPVSGCTEAEAAARIDRVLAAHAPEVKALADFARSGTNRVVFVPGDHDAALLFPGVARRLTAALNAPRAHVADGGSWLSADGKLYAEHGHQLDFSADRFDAWPKPFVQLEGRTHLARPWGEQAAQGFYDRLEIDYPVVDNVAARSAGLKFGLAAAAVADLGEQAPPLLKYFLFGMPWPQFRTDLDGGDAQPPTWDLARIRTDVPTFLAASLPDDDRFKPLALKALGEKRLDNLAKALTDEELVAVCDYRAAVRRSRRRMEQALNQLPAQGPAPAECPRTPETRGPSFEYFWRSRDGMIARRLAEVQRQVPHPEIPLAVYVFGHTHLPDIAKGVPGVIERLSPGDVFVPFGFSPIRRSATPVAINDGAWQRVVTPKQLETIKSDRGWSDQELMRSIRLEQLAPCYSFVEIAPYEGSPSPRTVFWRLGAQGGWEMSLTCGQAPSVGPR